MKNIAEILKDAPKGLKLYSPVFGEVEFLEIPGKESLVDGTVKIKDVNGCIHYFDECGRYSNIGDCVLFPSKEHQTWDNWRGVIIPRCVGSVIVSEYKSVPFRWIVTKTGWLSLSTEDRRLTAFYEFCTLNLDSGNDLRFATSEETEQCFNELERQCYKFVDGEVVEVVEKSVDYSGKWVVLGKSMSGVQSRDGDFWNLDEGDVFFCEGMSMFGLCNVVHERSGMEFKIRPSLLREWTIKDAKNGDFIYDGYLDVIFIFNAKIGDEVWCSASVCKSLPENTLEIYFINPGALDYREIIDKAKFRPATAKEKQLLVRLIRERGYFLDPWTHKLYKRELPENTFNIHDFKCGDFVYNESCDQVFIFRYIFKDDVYCDASLSIEHKDVFYAGHHYYSKLAYLDECRPATQEEKQILIGRLEEEGYEWDDKIKHLEKKWSIEKAKSGDFVYEEKSDIIFIFNRIKGNLIYPFALKKRDSNNIFIAHDCNYGFEFNDNAKFRPATQGMIFSFLNCLNQQTIKDRYNNKNAKHIWKQV